MIEPKSSFPVFIVEDLEAAKIFYTENLSFELVFSGDWYIHLLSKFGIQVGFLLPNQPTQPPIFHKACSGDGVIFTLEVEDVNAAFESAKSNSLNIVLELRSEDWGQRHFCLKDPNGVFLDIVQATDPSEEFQSDYLS